MTPRDFVYWLQGFFEISGADSLTEGQVQIIQDHLNLVFQKETPDRSTEGMTMKEIEEMWGPIVPLNDDNEENYINVGDAVYENGEGLIACVGEGTPIGVSLDKVYTGEQPVDDGLYFSATTPEVLPTC